MCDLLPESVNLILDDVETSLCLPILVIIILCTGQIILNHILDIGSIVQELVHSNPNDTMRSFKKGCPPKTCNGMVDKVKGIFHSLGFGGSQDNSNEMPKPIGSYPCEEEWDYCNENWGTTGSKDK